MPDMTIYLPDELHRQAKDARLPVSKLCQEAFRKELVRLESARCGAETITVLIRNDKSSKHTKQFQGRWLVEDETPLGPGQGISKISIAETAHGRLAVYRKFYGDETDLLVYETLDLMIEDLLLPDDMVKRVASALDRETAVVLDI